MTRTVETIVNDIYDRYRLGPPSADRRAKVLAIDDVLDKVREMLQATGHAAEMVAFDEVRVLMGRVDDA
jgi:hypothetical protein